VQLTGDWQKAAKIASGLEQRFQKAVSAAVMAEGQYLRGQIIKGIRSGAPGGKAFAPLSPVTIAIRKAGGFGGSKPLIRTGALVGSITATKIGGGVFVGILRQAKSKGGKSLANLGEIHEFGRSWSQRFTAKARRFLFAMLRRAGIASASASVPKGPPGGGDKTIQITIPARPFIGPVLEREGKPEAVAKRFWQRVAKSLGGDLGSL
jgi:hypothetical protein